MSACVMLSTANETDNYVFFIDKNCLVKRGSALRIVCVIAVFIAMSYGGDDVCVGPTETETLVAQNKDVVMNYMTLGDDKCKEYQADPSSKNHLIDAYIFYEMARRIASANAIDEIRCINQKQYWCRKEMDIDSIGDLLARLKAIDGRSGENRRVDSHDGIGEKSTKGISSRGIELMSRGENRASSGRESQVASLGETSEKRIQEKWMLCLYARICDVLATGYVPRFYSRYFGSSVNVLSSDMENGIRVQMGESSATVALKHLNVGDLLKLALDVTKGDAPDQHRLAAYFLFLNGDIEAADYRLARGGYKKELRINGDAWKK